MPRQDIPTPKVGQRTSIWQLDTGHDLQVTVGVKNRCWNLESMVGLPAGMNNLPWSSACRGVNVTSSITSNLM